MTVSLGNWTTTSRTTSSPTTPRRWPLPAASHQSDYRPAGCAALLHELDAVPASKKLRGDELLITGFAATRLRMELDRIPLWGGDHVAVKQLVEHFARYLYLPRLSDPAVLLGAIRDGVALLTWEREAFAFADDFDAGENRYQGLRGGQHVALVHADASGLLVKPEVSRRQLDREQPPAPVGGTSPGPAPAGGNGTTAPVGFGPGIVPRRLPRRPNRSDSTGRWSWTRPASGATPAVLPTR